MNEVPMSLIIEDARGQMIAAFNKVQENTKLPAFLMEGIVLDILAQVRNQKNLELMSDMNRLRNKQNHEEELINE